MKIKTRYSVLKAAGVCPQCQKPNPSSKWCCDDCREKYNAMSAAKDLELRREIIARLGGKCACCDLDDIRFLTIEHPNGGGRAHRKRIHGNRKLYRHYLTGQCDQPITILCWNCNEMTYYNGGVCPHKERG